MKYSQYFDRRKNTFEKAFSLINTHPISDQVYTIVELGTSRSFVSGGIPGCLNPDPIFWYPGTPEKWDWGAGIFTKVFSENLQGQGRTYRLYSIDPSPDAIRIVKTMCNDDSVHIVQDYSTNFLRNFKGKIDFLYMDHMESGEEASQQHLEDSKILVEMDLMSPNGVILIDDVGDNITETKGKYSIPFLLENGYEKILHEYQVLLTRLPAGIP
jgi:hypothetical protein